MYPCVKGELFEKRMSAMSGFGYVPQSAFTNDRGGAQIPSPCPSAHVFGMTLISPGAPELSSALPADAAGASALAAELEGEGCGASACFATLFEAPPPHASTTTRAKPREPRGRNERSMRCKKTTGAHRT